ncbi:MAG: hypothetical protein LBI45_06790 [Bacteroidales bacterium]|jgi:predicted RNase H-like HicB family nuclease|nr:hypothetical protein [Bacteroidales bacterium]
MGYTIAITQLEDGWPTEQCVQIPEAITQGKAMDGLMLMMKYAKKWVFQEYNEN